MTRLPTARLVTASPEEKRALALWLHERAIEQSIATDDDIHALTATGAASRPEPVEVGQIRLLSPHCRATASRLCYVAVLKKQGENWLVVPFGRYGVPAVPGEWQTQRDATHLHVLCAWNAFEMSKSVLARSWVVDRLARDEQQAAERLLSTTANERPTTSEIESRTGPALRHPLDPRYDYLEEERQWASSVADNLLNYPTHQSPKHLPLAAEDNEEYTAGEDRPVDQSEDAGEER